METRSPLSWDEILIRLQVDRQDERAWESLFERGWPLVVATVARQWGGANAAVEDVAQEVFVRILKYCSFPKLNDANSLRSYLATTARNTARTARQLDAKSARQRSQQQSELVEDTAPSAELLAMARELLDHEILPSLDETDRTIVEGLLDRRSLNEIAERTGLSYSAVGVRIHRLRQTLRKSLDSK